MKNRWVGLVCFSFQLLELRSQPVVIDRAAIVVGRRVVKTSDIDRDLRASQFLNRQKLDVGFDARRAVADRMIEQELIRQEIATGSWEQPSAADVDKYVGNVRQQRFAGSQSQFEAALQEYGLTADQFRQYARWQLMTLRFIDERFRPGILVTDEEIRSYYQEHRSELMKRYPNFRAPEEFEPVVRELISGQRVNEVFEEWLGQTRRQTRVEFRPAAFGGQLPATTNLSGAVEP